MLIFSSRFCVLSNRIDQFRCSILEFTQVIYSPGQEVCPSAYSILFLLQSISQRHNANMVIGSQTPARKFRDSLRNDVTPDLFFSDRFFGQSAMVGSIGTIVLAMLMDYPPFIGWCPPVTSWFINPTNYSSICHKP